jgi:hypothetical protein
MKKSRFLLVSGILGLVILAGFRTETWIDYDSGRERIVKSVWGLRLSDKTQHPTFFASFPLRNGLTGLTGKAKWHKAISLPFGSLVSLHGEAGNIAVCMSNCGLLLEQLNSNDAVSLKETFLQAVARGGRTEAERVIYDTQELLLRRPNTKESSSNRRQTNSIEGP